MAYLVHEPDDFTLPVFLGWWRLGHWSFHVDANGNLWSGMNWMPGLQSGVNKNTGGGMGK